MIVTAAVLTDGKTLTYPEIRRVERVNSRGDYNQVRCGLGAAARRGNKLAAPAHSSAAPRAENDRGTAAQVLLLGADGQCRGGGGLLKKPHTLPQG